MVAAARRWAAVLAGMVVGAGVVTVPTPTEAAPPPAVPSTPTKVDRTLGNGLGRLVAQGPEPARRRVLGPARDPGSLAVRDDRGRVLVDLTPAAGTDRTAFRRSAEAAGLRVQSTDPERGTLEGFVALDDVPALDALPGRGTLASALRPRAAAGKATGQGVGLQRVDRVHRRGVDGAGVTVGALSDSYDTASTTLEGQPLTVHAADDVASGDLPGEGNPANPTPVTVLQDHASWFSTTDEGRAMLQVVHDVAPAARLCFATAQGGQVGFAANIRRLADKAGPCGADVIVDDLLYFDEPMFSDGVVSDAVDAAAASGVHYLSAAGNAGSNQAWESGVHLVAPADAVARSNLDLTHVDPRLYDGGFQDMQPGPGIDVTQDVRLGNAGGLVDLQWDDPVDLDGPTLGEPYLATSGTVTGAEPAPTFPFTPTAEQLGTTVQFRADGVPSGTTDLRLTVTAPDGTVLGSVDDGVFAPEVFSATLDQAGEYRVEVSGFDGETGDFTLSINPVLEPSAVSTDFNVLFFGPDGDFLGTAADVNARTGRPLELAGFPALPQVQMVVARSGGGKVGAHRVRAVLFGSAAFAEHADPAAPAVFGHAAARGATAVAAYGPFGPYLPEPFTAPGGRLEVLFDSAGRRLDQSRQVRTVPQVAGVDGANTTFFGVDTSADPDTQPNFFGTSAAAPQVAGIAALVLQRSRREGADLSPARMRRRLQGATFAHDLDPFRSRATAAGVVLSAEGGQSPESGPVPGSMTDPHFFTLRNVRGPRVRSVTLDLSTASPTAPGTEGTTTSAGMVFDPRPYEAGQPRDSVGFPFTVGATGGGLEESSVTVSYGDATGIGQHRTMTLTFAQGFARGQRLEFGVDRDLVRPDEATAKEGNGADELGGATDLGSGKKRRGGLTLVVTGATGRQSKGTMRNELGSGRTVVDGYGLVDAAEATLRR